MGVFFDILDMLTTLFERGDQDGDLDDLSEVYGAQDRACDYEPDVPDAYRYRH